MGGALSQWGQGGRFERISAWARPGRFSCFPAAREVAVPPAPGELSSFRGPCAGRGQVVRQVGGCVGRARTHSAGLLVALKWREGPGKG